MEENAPTVHQSFLSSAEDVMSGTNSNSEDFGAEEESMWLFDEKRIAENTEESHMSKKALKG